MPAPPERSVPYTLVVPTHYGQMLVNRHDINQTASLIKRGVAIDHGDISILAAIVHLLGPNAVVADIGANFGAYSLALAPLVGPAGKIHAFEPQRIIFNMLAGSVALNGI